MDKKLTKAQVRKQMRLVRSDLHYWQMEYRMALSHAHGCKENVLRDAAQMRKLQSENKADKEANMRGKK